MAHLNPKFKCITIVTLQGRGPSGIHRLMYVTIHTHTHTHIHTHTHTHTHTQKVMNRREEEEENYARFIIENNQTYRNGKEENVSNFAEEICQTF